MKGLMVLVLKSQNQIRYCQRDNLWSSKHNDVKPTSIWLYNVAWLVSDSFLSPLEINPIAADLG